MPSKRRLMWQGLLGGLTLWVIGGSFLWIRHRRIVAMSLDSRIQLSPPLSGADVADLLGLNVIRIHLKASKGETIVTGYVQGNKHKGMSFRRVDEDIDTDVLLAYRAGVDNEAILTGKFLGPPYDKSQLKMRLPFERVVSVMSMNLKQDGGPDVLGFHLHGDKGERLVLGFWVSEAPRPQDANEQKLAPVDKAP